jgi:hypothetical protein
MVIPQSKAVAKMPTNFPSIHGEILRQSLIVNFVRQIVFGRLLNRRSELPASLIGGSRFQLKIKTFSGGQTPGL